MSLGEGSGVPAISVVVPHLDDPAGLRACLAALAAQRDAGVPFEVIVVDNGSKRSPAAVCAGFSEVRLAVEPTPGPGPARSRGAGLARGEILAFIDSDCVADAGWIAGIARHFARPGAADVVGGAVRIAPADPRRLTMVEAFESVYGYRMRLFVERDGYTATCNMAVRRAVFVDVGPFVGIAVAEDMEWGRRATARGYRLAYVPAIAVATRARGSFAELARKWDRHIAHDFAVIRPGARGRMAWVLRALIIAGSPLAEIPTVAATRLLAGPRARMLAFAGVVRIRLYRARKMLWLAFGGDAAALGARWRRG